VSTACTTELALMARANAYVSLTKPDVSFLVLMTTAAGYYMGARGPVDWLHMMHTVFATMLMAGTAALNHYIERESDRHMRRTACRPLPSGVLQPRDALWFGVVLSLAGALDLYLTAGALAAGLGVATCLSLSAGLHASEKAHGLGDLCRSFPGGDSADDWMGRRNGLAGPRRLDAVRNTLLLAVSPFLCHLLDVPRRLRACGHPDATCCG
jgi:hypothetical protein